MQQTSSGHMNLSIDLSTVEPLTSEQMRQAHDCIHRTVAATVKESFGSIEAAAVAQGCKQEIDQYADKGVPFSAEEMRQSDNWKTFTSTAILKCHNELSKLGFIPKDGTFRFRPYFYTLSEKTANNALKAALPPSAKLSAFPMVVHDTPEPSMHEKFYGAKNQFNAENLQLEESIKPDGQGVRIGQPDRYTALALEEDEVVTKPKKRDAWSLSTRK